MGLNAGNIYIGVKGDLNPLDKALQSAWRASEKRSKQIERTFTKMERKVKRAWKSMSSGIGGVIAGLSFGALITETIKLADKYTLLEARVKLVTKGSEEFKTVSEDLFNLSQKTRIGYDKTLEVYARFARATEQVGTSQSDLIEITGTINKLIKISGATAVEADAALIQFSQGLAAGALRGQELNSVMEQTPAVINAIADGMGIARSQIKSMAKEGIFTAEAITAALKKQAAVVEKEFSKIPLTVSDAWIKITNTVGKAINETNKHIGVTSKLAESLDFLNTTLESVTNNIEKYLDVTISGLKAIGKIAAAGGALWLLPIVIAKTHKVMVLLNLTMFKLQTGALGLNSALFGTSVSANLAAGSLTKMHLAGSSLMALFVGWELGKWANDNFEEVRLVGLSTIAGLNEKWIKFKFNFLQLWIDMKFGAIGAFEGIRTAMATIIDDIAKKMSGVGFTIKNPFGDDFQVGLDSAAAKLEGVADKIRSASTATKEHNKATQDLRKEMDKSIEIHERTVEILIQERDWVKKIETADDEKTDSQIENNERIIESTTERTDQQKALEEDVTTKIHELRNDEFWHKTYLLEQEVAKMEETAGLDAGIQDKITTYHELKQQEILDDYNEKNKGIVARNFETGEILQATNQTVVNAFIRGENVKMSLSRLASEKISGFAIDAATEGLARILSALGVQVGANTALGVVQSSLEGQTWQQKIASGAAYLAGAGAAILAGKELGKNFASGGWIDRNPNGGVINTGSGTRDDVFLKYTRNKDGAPIKNMGMGSEFVVNKETTRKNIGFLHWLNKQKTAVFAAGGPVGNPMSEAESFNDSGFDTFWDEVVNTRGNFYAAIAQSVAYYGGAIAGMIAGKHIGKNLFAGGGLLTKNFGFGDWIDPFGIVEQTQEIIDPIVDPFGITDAGSINWGPIWDALRDLPIVDDTIRRADKILYPFMRDILTPGREVNNDTVTDSLKGMYEGLGEELLKEFTGYGLAGGGLIPAYANGSNFVPTTGMATIHQGERIFSAMDNKEIVNAVKNSGGDVVIESKPMIKVFIGDKELKEVAVRVADDLNARRNRRNQTGRTKYGAVG